jgi:hypothetical protein
MHKNIHKQSLKITLLENKVKIKKNTKNLIVLSIVISIALVVFSFTIENSAAFLIAIPTASYTLYASYQILSLWSTHKKIKQKIKTL